MDKQGEETEGMSVVQAERLPELILPRTGRGSQYVKALRAAILELIDTQGSISKNELEKTVCLDWNIMSRSFDHHFNDMIQFGLVSGEEKGLRLTQRGRDFLNRVLQDESVEQVRTRPRPVSEKHSDKGGDTH